MPPPEAASARDKVLFHLKTKGPQTALQLARRLAVTPMAVRQHLYGLAGDGLVAYEDERRKVGRPARIWRLTPAASGRFPDAHGDLTVEILRAVRATFGDSGLAKLVAARTRQQQRTYRDRMPGRSAPLEERVAALAAIRREEGYMAECGRDRDGSFLLSENHCPICAAATTCQGLCHEELSLFRTILGPGVTVARTDHILAGARRCAYRIAPKGRRSTPRPSRAE